MITILKENIKIILMVYSIFQKIKDKTLFSSDQIADFIGILNEYLHNISINTNNEDNLKTDLTNLLSNFFLNYIANKPFSLRGISTIDIDLAIFDKFEKVDNDFIRILFETKIPNHNDMITQSDLNKKALHEAILYYFIEKEIEPHNHQIEYIIITDFLHWFIINSENFRRSFHTKQGLMNNFNEYSSGTGDGNTHTTGWFYGECESFLADESNSNILSNLKYIYIDLSNLNRIEDSMLEDDFQSIEGFFVKDFLITFRYILSPAFLLNKAEIYRNANRLNRTFYTSLLNIIGVKEKSSEKKQRSEILIILDEDNIDGLIHKVIDKIKRDFLDQPDEQVFEASLGLCLNWVNRLLFIKLLEAHLIKVNQPPEEETQNYYIIHADKLTDFNDFDTLFFDVLAKEAHTVDVFKHVPFLNSSLFDRSLLELTYHTSLGDQHDYDVTKPVLLKLYKKFSGNEVNSCSFISLLLEFLNYFDFGSGKEIEVTENLINASVLGLIFEKINGYKEASYYTPSQVTEFVCENTIRNAVLDKINEFLQANEMQKQNSLENIKDIVQRKIDDKEFLLGLNKAIDDIKICDPAVGSGHFLVSALNELLRIKCDLELTFNKDNDFVIIFCKYDEYRELEYFKERDYRTKISYKKNNGAYDFQREQETIFHMKKVILENCLYGVDINPNSVVIARLRLWIELIKNAFFTAQGKMETLPNIDINIRRGDSLFNRIPFDHIITEGHADLEEIKQLITQYKEERDQRIKVQISDKLIGFKKKIFLDNTKRLINEEKKILVELKKQRRTRQTTLTATEEDNEEREKEKARLSKRIKSIESKIKEKEKTDYASFEWKLEFPDILDENFNFLGFNVIILNPPYISFISTKKARKVYSEEMIEILRSNYDYKIKRKREKGKGEQSISDLYELFLLRSIQIVKPHGYIGIITSDSFTTIDSFETFRLNLLEELPVKFLIWKPCPIDTFENENPLSPLVSTSILIIEKTKSPEYEFIIYDRPKVLDFFNVCEEYPANLTYFKNSIRRSFWIPNPQNVELNDKIIKVHTQPPFFKFKSLFQATTRLDLTEESGKNNNSEFLAVLDTDVMYAERARKYNEKCDDEGKDIAQLSKDRKLRGKVWKIIREEDIIRIEDMTDEQKLNGTDHKWIPMVKGSGVAAIEENPRYYKEMHYYVDWDKNSVKYYSSSKENRDFFWKSGIYVSLSTPSKSTSFMLDESSRLKCAVKPPGPNDVNFTSIYLNRDDLDKYLLGILNTKFIFKIKLTFINHTTATQKTDLEEIPIREPNPNQKSFIEERVDKCIEIQKNSLSSVQFNGRDYTLEELEKEIEEKTIEIYDVIRDLFI